MSAVSSERAIQMKQTALAYMFQLSIKDDFIGSALLSASSTIDVINKVSLLVNDSQSSFHGTTDLTAV